MAVVAGSMDGLTWLTSVAMLALAQYSALRTCEGERRLPGGDEVGGDGVGETHS